MARPWVLGGSRTLGEISGTALLRLQMQLQLRRHARMKTRPWACLSCPVASKHPMALASARPVRTRRRLGTRPGRGRLFLAVQASRVSQYPQQRWGGRGSVVLAVEDERLPWSLEAPSGED
ncbi:hypothetical protein CCMA1212_008089 [Trichoderma ghanense]|uniref:Uncharacterized protein n=1 Tax=Trichoderma ghanense TaxID=65468 RepID=A0ABY2GVR7_9HYPO